MPGVIARMPISMDPLALVFIVVSVSDSYALAGALSATSSVVMALATPHWSRVADRMGQEDKIGVLLAIWAGGSAVAAIINGVVKWKLTNAAMFLIFLFALTLLSVPMLFTHSMFWLGVALFFNGFAIAPLVINAYAVAGSAVPSAQITETLTWVIAGIPIGGALASALAGQVIDRFGSEIAYWVPLGFMIAACAATLPYFSTYKALIGYSRARE